MGPVGISSQSFAVSRPGRFPGAVGARRRYSVGVLALCLSSGAGLAGVTGCLPTYAPQLPQSVSAAVAQHPMRSVESENLRLYFPEAREQEARRFLTNVEGCAADLRRAAQVHNAVADQKMIFILPELPFNNAFVSARLLGYDPMAVVPTLNTSAIFAAEMALPPDPAHIACHELVHYVHLQQVAGFAWFWNAAFGAVYTPQIGLDGWFSEGLAVYYETKFHPQTGRLASPFWRGAFAAGFAGRRINGGHLSAFNRAFHTGTHYLVGSQFVRFLADRYGEDRLWKLVNVQARSIFFPLWVNLRFWQVYDKTLSSLIDEFADEVEQNLVPRGRPAQQRVVRAAGNSARYARAADGTEALIAEDRDSPPRLLIYAPDGSLRSARTLTDIVPPRKLAIAGAPLTSGLSFTADGRSLYFVALDISATFQVARLLRHDLATGRLTVVCDDLRGTGGSVTPDGGRYLFAQANGDHHDLAAYDLRTGTVRVLAPQEHGAYLAQPRVSPDGKRVVASRFDGLRFGLAVYDAVTGAPLSAPHAGGAPVSDPSWVDDDRILFLSTEPRDAGFQVYVHQLQQARTTRVTDVPYLAFEPRASAADQTIRFLNRDGWGWTLDEVRLPGLVPALSSPPPPADTPPTLDGQAPPEALPLVSAEGPSASRQGALAEATGEPGADLTTRPLDHQPYSQFDNLFIPRLHGPTFQFVGRRAASLGLVFSGNDRLVMHRWTVAGTYQFAGGGSPSFLAGYSNRQLAPFTFTAFASQIEVHDVPPVPPGQDPPLNPAFTLYRRDRQLSLDVSRVFYGNPVALGGSLIETYRPDDPAVLVARRRFAGPQASARFTGVDTTPYTEAHRLFSVAGVVAAYPRAWNTAGAGFVDGRAEVNTVFPLPLPSSWALSPAARFWRRHTFAVGLRGRTLFGLSRDQPLLMVGGLTDALLGRSANRPEPPAAESPLLPPGISFFERLRGFEDYPFLTDRIYIADASYHFPFIIDRGTASTLALLPAFFVRQLDLELFGSAATEARAGVHHVAAGGAVSLRLALWAIPFSFRYQFARRATDDHGTVHLVTLGP